MPRPPEPWPQGEAEATELEEVERALSILDGRHPDFRRTEREMREATRQACDLLEQVNLGEKVLAIAVE